MITETHSASQTKYRKVSSLQGDIEKKHRWLVERKGYRKTGQCPAGL